jgi:hypothetical protein
LFKKKQNVHFERDIVEYKNTNKIVDDAVASQMYLLSGVSFVSHLSVYLTIESLQKNTVLQFINSQTCVM